MDGRFRTKVATVAIMIAVLAATGAMSACHNGPSSDHDTNGVSTSGAAGQVLLSPSDTIHHAPTTAGATGAPGSTPAATDTMRRDTTRRRP
jgi:hypothetical protein